MKQYKKFVTITLTILFSCLLLAGCSFHNTKVIFTTGFEESQIFRLESMYCTKSELMVYLVNMQKQYEKAYGAEVWETSNQSELESGLKESALERLARVKAMNLIAGRFGVLLSDADKDNAKRAAKEYYNTLNATEKEVLNTSEGELTQMYQEYCLAEKLYRYIVQDVSVEISDDEARIITVDRILTGSYNKIVEAKGKLEAGENFSTVASTYNEIGEVTESFGKGTKDEEYERIAFNLGTGEVSGIVETTEGYAIIKCISTFDKNETEANKIKILQTRKEEAFDATYEELASNMERTLNEKLWKTVLLPTQKEIVTSSFWEVYQSNYTDKL